jgi:class 3 adenylate cyclase
MIDRDSENMGIIHQLLGDGFMAIFGAPVTHGSRPWMRLWQSSRR